MPPPPIETTTPESLLEQSDWIRRLARRLAHDGARADDLAQDTWVRLLSHPPPRDDRPIRGWIATVMRNLRSHGERTDRRRAARERVNAESRFDPDDSLDRVARQRAITDIVLALDEPYRTTLVLRYFENCTPKRIAALQGVPVSTVKTRLARGLERLRARLAQEHGSGREWLSALAPLLQPVLGAKSLFAPVPIGAIIMHAKWLTAAVVILAASATWIVFNRSESPSRAAVTDSIESDPAAPNVASTGTIDAAQQPTSDTDRIPVEGAGRAIPANAAADQPAIATAAGRVLSADGRSVGGVALRFEVSLDSADPGAIVATTNQDGEFEIEVARRTGRLVAAGPEFATALAARHGPGVDGERVLVVAPRIEIRGRVVDHLGASVADAVVDLAPPDDLRARVGTVLDESATVDWTARTDADGQFELLDGGAISDSTLNVRATGHALYQEPAPRGSRDGLLITLPEPASAGRLLEGIVVDAAGVPVRGARVAMGIDTVTTHDDGTFAFDLDAETSFNSFAAERLTLDVSRLIAVKPGHLPGTATTAEHDADGRPIWQQPVRIELGGQPLTIRGQVLDAKGDPLPGIPVWTADPTMFGALGDPAARRGPEFIHVEQLLVGAAAGEGYVQSDADGRFRIEGLLERAYTLHALDVSTLQRAVQVDVPAGQSQVVLQFTEEGLYPTLRGIAVDSNGTPLAGVDVIPMCDTFRTRIQGQTVRTRHATIDGVRTDADGRFELERVPRDLAYLRFEGGSTIPLEWGRQVEGGLASLVGDRFDDLVVELPRRCHFTVELRDTAEADSFAVLDKHGETLTVSEFLGRGRREGPRQRLLDGHSNPSAVSDAGATLVLFRGDAELRRLPIRLDPDEPVTIRP